MVSTAIIAPYLEGLDFPATKQEIIDYVEPKDPPADIVEILEKLPEETYFSLASLWQAIGDVE